MLGSINKLTARAGDRIGKVVLWPGRNKVCRIVFCIKVYGQVTLTFRYGREDEEVMGLKFCNEAIMSLAQLYPPYHPVDRQEPTTPFQVGQVNFLVYNTHKFEVSRRASWTNMILFKFSILCT